MLKRLPSPSGESSTAPSRIQRSILEISTACKGFASSGHFSITLSIKFMAEQVLSSGLPGTMAGLPVSPSSKENQSSNNHPFILQADDPRN